jgi:hypothetical protein
LSALRLPPAAGFFGCDYFDAKLPYALGKSLSFLVKTNAVTMLNPLPIIAAPILNSLTSSKRKD